MKNKKIIKYLIMFFISLSLLYVVQYRCFIKVKEIVRNDIVQNYEDTLSKQAIYIDRSLDDVLRALSQYEDDVENLIKNNASGFDIAKSFIVLKDRFATEETLYVDTSGMAYSSNNKKIDFSSVSQVSSRLNGKKFVSVPFVKDDDTMVMFSFPIVENNKAIGNIALLFSLDELEEYLQVEALQSNGSTFLISKEGTVLASYNPLNKYNVYKYFKRDEKKRINDIVDKLIKNNELNSDFSEDNDLIVVTPINNNGNFYILTIANSKIIKAREDMAKAPIFKMLTISFLLLSGFIIFLFVNLFGSAKRENDNLKKMAYKDLVTGGFNLQYFTTEFHKKTANKGYVVALDIKGFKTFEKLYTEKEVDEIIKNIFKIVDNNITGLDLLGHEQRDLFALFICAYNRVELEDKLNKINNDLLNYSAKKSYPELRAYFGISERLDENTTASELYAEAKVALRNKKNLNVACHYYEQVDDSDIKLEQEIISDFFKAIKEERFFLEYQPIFSNRTGKITSAEAFVSLKRQDGSYLPLSSFSKILEKNGLIFDLDYYVFKKNARFIKRQLDENKTIVPISMNFSYKSLYQNNVVKKLLNVTDEYNISPKMITLELDEIGFVQEVKMDQTIEEILNAGFEIEVDKFGESSASLRSLASLNFKIVKISKQLMNSIGNPKSEMVLRHIVSLSSDLGMDVVAHVENEVQAKFTKELGIAYVQGSYCSNILADSEFVQILDHFIELPDSKKESFEFIDKNSLSSILASSIFSDEVVSQMTGAIAKIGLKDDEIYFLGCNKELEIILGLNHSLLQMSNEYFPIKKLVYNSDASLLKDLLIKAKEEKRPQTGKVNIRVNNGNEFKAVKCTVCYKNEMFSYEEAIVFVEDYIQEYDTELISRIPGGLIIFKPNDNQFITSVNNELLNILGYNDREEFDDCLKKNFEYFIYEQDYGVVMNSMFTQFFASQNKEAHVKFRVKKKSGKIIYVDVQARYISDGTFDDCVYCFVRSLEGQSDFALEEENKIARLKYESTHDGLTGLVNQASIKDLANEIFMSNPNTEFALVVMDIDDFKKVNDKYGHAFGDRVIKAFASKLRSCIMHPGICGRVGGDEFVALEPLVKETIEQFGQRVLETMRFTIGECAITPSIGIVGTHLIERNYVELFLNADISLYASKNAGKNTYTIYSPGVAHVEYQNTNRNFDNFDPSRIIETLECVNKYTFNYLFALDLRTNKIFLTSKALNDFNISNATMFLNDFISQCVFESDGQMIREEVNRIRNGESMVYDTVTRLLDKNKVPIWVKCEGKLIKNSDRPWCLIGGIGIVGK